MPPWHAQGEHGTFANDQRLNAIDKSTILRWSDGGAPKGDDALKPASPVNATAWEIGEPDAVVTMQETSTVPARGTVEYQYFELATGFTEDKWVQQIEFMPGAREVMHQASVLSSRRQHPQKGSA